MDEKFHRDAAKARRKPVLIQNETKRRRFAKSGKSADRIITRSEIPRMQNQHEETTMMKRMIAHAATSRLLAGMTAETAHAWTRNATTTTPRGVYSSNGGGSCGGGSCSRSRTVTGPYGKSVTRSGTVTHSAPYGYSYSGTVTGPYGGTVNRSRTVVRGY